MSQPAGPVRDDAILVMAHSLDEYSPSPERLFATIGDPTKRRQAEYAYLMRIAQSDPSRARSMIATMGLSPEERQQLERQLAMMQRL
jgi:hypothetical protein